MLPEQGPPLSPLLLLLLLLCLAAATVQKIKTKIEDGMRIILEGFLLCDPHQEVLDGRPRISLIFCLLAIHDRLMLSWRF